MRKIEFIAYIGLEFTIEWYYNQKGETPALHYFNKLNPKMQQKIFYLFLLREKK